MNTCPDKGRKYDHLVESMDSRSAENHPPGRRKIMLTLILSTLLVLALAVVRTERTKIRHTPYPAGWLQDRSAIPEWWTPITIDFTNSLAYTNWTSRLAKMEIHIIELAGIGISPVRERQEVIKCASLLRDSPGLPERVRQGLKTTMAYTYARMGDHKTAAQEYAEALKEYPDDAGLTCDLARECECLGDRQQALQWYGYGAQLYQNNKNHADSRYATNCANMIHGRIAGMKGLTRDCGLTKPGWWDEFRRLPGWWEKVAFSMPLIASYEDGRAYMWTVRKDADGRKFVKASKALSEFVPLTHHEKMDATMQVALAYALMDDHHRAIESAWTIPEQFSGDSYWCACALKFIASEFEQLGEANHAQEIRNLMPCFESEK
jgi:tetratricopeptide (TPR) repeat protein